MVEEYQLKGVEKDEYPTLFSITQNLMRIYGINKVRVFIRPRFGNAAALSFFGNYIIIGKPLIAKLNEDELEGVLSHEFSHLFNRDSFTSLILSLIFAFPALFFYYQIDPQNPSFPMVTLFFLSFFFMLYGFRVRNWITLNSEIRADREAVLKTKNPKAMQSALIKLTTQPLIASKRPSYFSLVIVCFWWLIAYFIGFDHPHLKERIEYLEFTHKILECNETAR